MPSVGIIFRDRLKMTLESARISQSSCAVAAGMHTSMVNQIIRGKKHAITAESVVRIAIALGVSTDWLLGLSANGPKPAAVRNAIAIAGAKVQERPGQPDQRNLGKVGSATRRGRTVGRSQPIEEVDSDAEAD